MKALRSLFGLALVVGMIYTGWQVFPPYFNNFQFEEVMDDAARAASVPSSRLTDADIRQTVLKQAQNLDIPIQAEQIQVQRGRGEYMVWGEYTVHIDLPIYPFDLHFQPMSKSKKRAM